MEEENEYLRKVITNLDDKIEKTIKTTEKLKKGGES
mgnify:CR=1 FL=1